MKIRISVSACEYFFKRLTFVFPQKKHPFPVYLSANETIPIPC